MAKFTESQKQRIVRSGNLAAFSAMLRGDVENAMVAATPGGIEAQESAGQAALVASGKQLPRDCPRTELEILGFQFGREIDDIFIEATFPLGWRLEATDHPMRSNLLDPNGCVRATVFYKAAFYDRRARLSLLRRYQIRYVELPDKTAQWNVYDSLEKRDVFVGKPFKESNHALSSQSAQDAYQWLNENFADPNPLAYW